jgi:molecular chaperone Hsp33
MTTSRQYHFINNTNGFSVSFIEGHSALDELNKIHDIGPYAFSFYQKTLLSSLQMLNFLKANEHLGFYIDSEEPYFRFKVEISPSGEFRTLLLPEEFDDFPTTLTGKCRLSKMTMGKTPYTTILDFNEHPLEELVNEIIDKSYQTNAFITLSKDESSSLMVLKLPPSNVNKKIDDFEDIDMKTIQEKYNDLFENALKLKKTSVEEVEELFKAHGLTYLGSKEVKFHCPCSRQRMADNLLTLPLKDRVSLFDKMPVIEVRCDYCNSIYDVSENDVLKPDLH